MKLSFRQSIKSTENIITVVSGLPRSGTSMLMKMLHAGGMEILSDNLRQADEDNPQGYLEFERVKKLKEGDTDWLPEAQGKAVKVISYLLQFLPDQYVYEVIFVERDLQEVLASQRTMLLRRGEPADTTDDHKMAEIFSEHLKEVKHWMRGKKNMRVLFLNYADVLQLPHKKSKEIVKFLSQKLDEEAMAAIPDKSLHHQRKAG